MKKFLMDSCYMQPVSGGSPDLRVSIHCQASSYAYDAKEETHLKVEVKATLQQLKPGGNTVERAQVLHEKSYDTNREIPAGEFFWETSGALKLLLRDMLRAL
jgi:hypothetical protein